MQRSESIANISAALVAFQAEEKVIVKDAENPFFKSKYATLDGICKVIRPLLAKHKLTVVQLLTGENELETVILHEGGEFISAQYIMAVKDMTPQSQGSATTYGRRYALCAALGLTADDDDDANSAQEDSKKSALRPMQSARSVKPRGDTAVDPFE